MCILKYLSCSGLKNKCNEQKIVVVFMEDINKLMPMKINHIKKK